jgi:hypothetical protein
MNTAMVPMDFSALAQGYIQSTSAVAAPPKTGDSMIETIVGAAEIGGMAMLMGYLNARSPAEDKTHHEMFGYPTDVVVGFGGIGLGLIMALFGSQSFGHVVRLGIGSLIEAGVRMGLEKGVADREADKEKTAAAGNKAALRLVEQNRVRPQFSQTLTQPRTNLARQPVAVNQDVFLPVR